MENAAKFREKLGRGDVCLGTCVSFTDPTVTEALSAILDFVWIDMEHSVLSLEDVQGHVLATKGSDTTTLVRVPWNDPVRIKPVLDLGADGIIVPNVRTVEEARGAIAACLYPPEGIRGFGPRRPSRYGRIPAPQFCRDANESIVIVLQIEHIDGVRDIDQILALPGLTSLVVGPNDLSGSLGHMGHPEHPDVVRAIETVFDRAKRAGIPVGIAVGEDPDKLAAWIDKGASWVSMGNDVSLLLRSAGQVATRLRGRRAVQEAR